MTPPLFPLFLKLNAKSCLVVGGGAVAERKVRSLLKAAGLVTVVAPEITTGLTGLLNEGRIAWKQRKYLLEDIHQMELVFVATNDNALNQSIARHCQKAKILVNVADTPKLCSFFMPAVVDRFPLQIAISTNGASPVLAAFLRTKLELLFPPSYAAFTHLLSRLRPWVKRRLPDPKLRLRFWHALLESPEVESVLKISNSFDGGDVAGPNKKTLQSLADGIKPDRRGQVQLVGAGPGDPDLLTVKALRLIQQADVIVHDHLITEEILNCARTEAERISVGKRCGQPSASQSEINSLLIRLAQEGKRVVRLKGGDPFIFGRGGEEVEALHRAGVLCEVVPGITAALGCAAALKIPLTHRQLSHSVVFMTGHPAQEKSPYNWNRYCQRDQTLVVYMGLSNLLLLSEQLKKHGMRSSMPAALVQGGTTQNQKTAIGTVDELPQLALRGKFVSPVLVIIGEVVRLHDLNRFESTALESHCERT